jgi:hypothetical protein
MFGYPEPLRIWWRKRHAIVARAGAHRFREHRRDASLNAPNKLPACLWTDVDVMVPSSEEERLSAMILTANASLVATARTHEFGSCHSRGRPQVCDYVIAAVLLMRARRRLRQAVSMGMLRRLAFDTSLPTDRAASRAPTGEERIAAMEQSMSELTRSHRDLTERLDTQAVKRGRARGTSTNANRPTRLVK